VGADRPAGPADAAAVRDFPELAWLIALRNAGWRFLSPRLDDEGRPYQVDGLFPWPEGWVDAVRVRSPTDTLGLRLAPGDPPGITWERAGSLADVAEGLLSLPEPTHRTAPRLVRATGPRLWTPDTWMPGEPE
jgi:hypothetical protein